MILQSRPPPAQCVPRQASLARAPRRIQTGNAEGGKCLHKLKEEAKLKLRLKLSFASSFFRHRNRDGRSTRQRLSSGGGAVAACFRAASKVPSESANPLLLLTES
jgi:hypothetical protein